MGPHNLVSPYQVGDNSDGEGEGDMATHINFPFAAMVSNRSEIQEAFFEDLFKGPIDAAQKCNTQLATIGMCASVLLAILAQKGLTEKRLEFNREASSGVNSSAYFLAVNVHTLVVQTIQVTIAASIVVCFRHPIMAEHNYFLWFFFLMWNTSAWALLIPLVIPPRTVLIFLTMFIMFFGLLMSGAMAPFDYEKIYENNFLSVLSGFLSTPRYFVESLVVSSGRCMPPQYGFTSDPTISAGFPEEKNAFRLMGMAMNDPSVSNFTCNGWFWNVGPALMVGLTLRYIAFGVINTFNQGQQAKKSFFTHRLIRQGSKSLYIKTALYWVILIALFVLTCFLILRKG